MTTSTSKRIPTSAATARTGADQVHRAEASARSGAWIAGIGLLAMSVVAAVANTWLGRLAVTHDTAGTQAEITGRHTTFWLVIAGFAITALLDIAVALGLYRFLAPVHRHLAALSAWLRAGYAMALLTLLAPLVTAARLTSSPPARDSAASPTQTAQQVLHAVTTFQTGWTISLTVFGLHLIIVGLLIVKSWYTPTWLGFLVALAGLGYVADGTTTAIRAEHSLKLAQVTFVGEILLMIWLLWRGRRISPERST